MNLLEINTVLKTNKSARALDITKVLVINCGCKMEEHVVKAFLLHCGSLKAPFT